MSFGPIVCGVILIVLHVVVVEGGVCVVDDRKFDTNARPFEFPGLFYEMQIFVLKEPRHPVLSAPAHKEKMSSKPPPPEEDPREWLLFDIEDQDPITADFLKPPPQTSPPVTPLP
jgi:hypothetical protein